MLTHCKGLNNKFHNAKRMRLIEIALLCFAIVSHSVTELLGLSLLHVHLNNFFCECSNLRLKLPDDIMCKLFADRESIVIH